MHSFAALLLVINLSIPVKEGVRPGNSSSSWRGKKTPKSNTFINALKWVFAFELKGNKDKTFVYLKFWRLLIICWLFWLSFCIYTFSFLLLFLPFLLSWGSIFRLRSSFVRLRWGKVKGHKVMLYHVECNFNCHTGHIYVPVIYTIKKVSGRKWLNGWTSLHSVCYRSDGAGRGLNLILRARSTVTLI